MSIAKLYVVGIGPGSPELMTYQARAALEEAEILCGYTAYIDLLRAIFPGKELLETPMTRETERCRLALERADAGKTVAMVCSGDAGVYGMAGLCYQLSADYPDVAIETVPGVTAANSGAALLGAPLGHDFAVISLSDLLTPWELIEKRLDACASADMLLCLYNPSSKKRHDYLQKACDIILCHQAPETICGTAKNIGREGEGWALFSLSELRNTAVDMFTTVFIGNSATRKIGGKMVTPRGYKNL